MVACNICREAKVLINERWQCVSIYCSDLSAQLRAERENGKRAIYFGSVPGGTTPEAGKLDHQRSFDADMHAYREAVRGGEQPDQVSIEAVRKNRQRNEALDRVIATESVQVQD